jgi:hypothetical protein
MNWMVVVYKLVGNHIKANTFASERPELRIFMAIH